MSCVQLLIYLWSQLRCLVSKSWSIFEVNFDVLHSTLDAKRVEQWKLHPKKNKTNNIWRSNVWRSCFQLSFLCLDLCLKLTSMSCVQLLIYLWSQLDVLYPSLDLSLKPTRCLAFNSWFRCPSQVVNYSNLHCRERNWDVVWRVDSGH